MPTRNIVVVCSGSHKKKVNLGEVFLTKATDCWGLASGGRQFVGEAGSGTEVHLVRGQCERTPRAYALRAREAANSAIFSISWG